MKLGLLVAFGLAFAAAAAARADEAADHDEKVLAGFYDRGLRDARTALAKSKAGDERKYLPCAAIKQLIDPAPKIDALASPELRLKYGAACFWFYITALIEQKRAGTLWGDAVIACFDELKNTALKIGRPEFENLILATVGALDQLAQSTSPTNRVCVAYQFISGEKTAPGQSVSAKGQQLVNHLRADERYIRGYIFGFLDAWVDVEANNETGTRIGRAIHKIIHPKPTLEGCEYDVERFERELQAWLTQQNQGKRSE